MSAANKKALFVVERNLYYKYYGPVIEGLLQAGVEVHLLHLKDPSKLNLQSQKLLYYPFLSQVPSFKAGPPVVASYGTTAELKTYISSRNILNVFSLHSRAAYHEDFSAVRWHCLQHGIDSFYEKDFDSDHFYVYSSSWINQDKFRARNLGTVHEVGHYYMNLCPLADREEILTKYNLPKEKRYLLFAPLPTENACEYGFIKGKIRRNFHVRRLLKFELSLLKELNTWADQSGYEILIKSRFKRFLGPEYSELGHVFYDETFYPSTLHELTSLADITICNFMPSAICTEALTMNGSYRVIDYPELSKEVLDHVNDYINNLFLPRGKNDLLNIKDKSWLTQLLMGVKPGKDKELALYKETFLKSSESGFEVFAKNLL